MMRFPVGGLLLAITAPLLSAGCLWEQPHRIEKRMARMTMGANTRRVAIPQPPPTVGGPRTIARTTGGSEVVGPSPDYSQGMTGNMQFSMRQTRHIYAGGELEFGPFERQGSYLGGLYAVIGAESRSSAGSISVELSGGRQWLRYELGAEDVGVVMLEPRARAQLALSEQVNLGAVIGAGLLDNSGWMAGVFLGVYSQTPSGR